MEKNVYMCIAESLCCTKKLIQCSKPDLLQKKKKTFFLKRTETQVACKQREDHVRTPRGGCGQKPRREVSGETCPHLEPVASRTVRKFISIL